MTTSVQLAKNFEVSYVMIASVFSVQHVTVGENSQRQLMQIYFALCLCLFCQFRREMFYFVNFGAKCFGLAFGGTFTRLEEGSELRRKYNRQEKFNAQLQE